MSVENLKAKIAGEIVLSANPGATLKKWREIFEISQTELAKHLNITSSTISDYEGNRRASPGIVVIKRFVDALFDVDAKKGGNVVKKFKESEDQTVFESVEFSKGINCKDFAKAIDAKVVASADKMELKQIFGVTILDSLKVILDVPYNALIKIFSTTNQRALIFTKTSTGRSPLVAIRLSPIKPACIVLHELEEVDKLAIKIAENEGIPLLVTKMPLEEIKAKLKEV